MMMPAQCQKFAQLKQLTRHLNATTSIDVSHKCYKTSEMFRLSIRAYMCTSVPSKSAAAFFKLSPLSLPGKCKQQ